MTQSEGRSYTWMTPVLDTGEVETRTVYFFRVIQSLLTHSHVCLCLRTYPCICVQKNSFLGSIEVPLVEKQGEERSLDCGENNNNDDLVTVLVLSCRGVGKRQSLKTRLH